MRPPAMPEGPGVYSSEDGVRLASMRPTDTGKFERDDVLRLIEEHGKKIEALAKKADDAEREKVTAIARLEGARGVRAEQAEAEKSRRDTIKLAAAIVGTLLAVLSFVLGYLGHHH